ncbi:MAG: IS66 family transposase [Oligoflexia bacterium]|nr:IS66 family transposase [Oligoflexia bacterium]
MTELKKESLRENFNLLKSDYEKITKQHKVTPELSAVIKSLIMLMELMIAIFMEKKVKKTSSNSHKPSSQTEKDQTSTQSGSKGKGKDINDLTSDNCKVRESIKLVTVTTCDHCGEDLSSQPSDKIERRTKIDIFFEKRVEHVDAEVKECPDCHGITKGSFPMDMPGPLQYGKGIRAFVINLLLGQFIALGRVQKTLRVLIGHVISEATILKYVMQLYYALEIWELHAKDEILQSKAMNCDETSLRVDKKKQWIHSYSSGDITLKFLHEKRGCEAIDDIGIIPLYGGTCIHDCWSAYLSYHNCKHGLCGSHLLRELQFIIESNDYHWEKNMKKLLKKIAKIISKRKNKKLTEKEYFDLLKNFRNIITRGKKELPIIVRTPEKKGRVAKSDAHNLLEMLDEHEEAVLAFARYSEVSFTNNRAERDLRMAKVKKKVSGCFRSAEFAKAYCRISSYLQTMENQGYHPMIAIQMVLDGKIPEIKVA